MTRRTARTAAIAIITALFFVSCSDAFYTTNLFKELGLGQVAPATAADINKLAPKEAFNRIRDDSSSPEYYNLLMEDEAVKVASVDKLVAAANDSSLTPVQQNEALVLAAAIELKTTEAAATVDNLVTNIAAIEALKDPEVADILALVLPPSIDTNSSAPPANFVAMIEAFQDASKLFLDLSGRVDEGKPLPEDGAFAAGDIAQYAIVSFIIDAIVPAPGYPTVADALWAVIRDPTTEAVTGQPDFSFDSTDPRYPLLSASAGGIDFTKLGQ